MIALFLANVVETVLPPKVGCPPGSAFRPRQGGARKQTFHYRPNCGHAVSAPLWVMLTDELTRLRSVIAHRGTAREIDAALMPIASDSDPQAIGPLLLMLNDETEAEALWSLVHAAEQFDHVTYVQHFLSVFPALVVNSSWWASILTMRVLNSDADRAELARQARTASTETRRALALTCEGINGRDARFLAKTTAVLLAASNDS